MFMNLPVYYLCSSSSNSRAGANKKLATALYLALVADFVNVQLIIERVDLSLLFLATNKMTLSVILRLD